MSQESKTKKRYSFKELQELTGLNDFEMQAMLKNINLSTVLGGQMTRSAFVDQVTKFKAEMGLMDSNTGLQAIFKALDIVAVPSEHNKFRQYFSTYFHNGKLKGLVVNLRETDGEGVKPYIRASEIQQVAKIFGKIDAFKKVMPGYKEPKKRKIVKIEVVGTKIDPATSTVLAEIQKQLQDKSDKVFILSGVNSDLEGRLKTAMETIAKKDQTIDNLSESFKNLGKNDGSAGPTIDGFTEVVVGGVRVEIYNSENVIVPEEYVRFIEMVSLDSLALSWERDNVKKLKYAASIARKQGAQMYTWFSTFSILTTIYNRYDGRSIVEQDFEGNNDDGDIDDPRYQPL